MAETPRTNEPRRIAVTGSAGVGKTTLARHLAGVLGLPYLAEGMRRRLEGGLDLHALGHGGLRTLLAELFDEMIAEVEAAARRSGGFVADRCAVDCAAFWLFYGFGVDTVATERVVERTRRAIALYDVIVVLPWDAVPLASDGVRTANPWLQLHYQTVLEGLLHRWAPPDRTAWLPMDVMSVSDRVAWVRRYLRHAGAAGN